MGRVICAWQLLVLCRFVACRNGCGFKIRVGLTVRVRAKVLNPLGPLAALETTPLMHMLMICTGLLG